MRVSIFETENWEKEVLESKLRGDLKFSESEISPTNLPETDTEVLSVFVGSKIDKRLLDTLPKLKLIATRTTGYDHIDIREARKKSVVVCNVPTYGENTVAEYAFALLLSLSRKTLQASDKIRNFGDFSFDGLTGFDLKGKTIGVVGTGHIGAQSIKIAKGFEMNVIAYDPFPNNELKEKLDFTYASSLEDLLANSDIVTLHAPYNEKTHHLINSANISKIRQGAYIINTARGGLIETDALVKALQEGRIAGAGIDVLENEVDLSDEGAYLKEKHHKESGVMTLLENHILMEMPNVIITPHAAFNTKESIRRILDTTIKNITSFTKGSPINTVAPKEK